MDVVLDRQIYISGTQGWEAAGSILKKGNYLWSIGPGGILLESSNVTALIPFKTPLKGSLKEWFEKAVEDIRMATVEDVINQNLIIGSLIHVPVKLSLLSGKKKGILVDYIADTIILK